MTGSTALGQGGGRRRPLRAINKFSAPSDLRITDLRVVTVASNFDYTIVRLDTIRSVRPGEIRDGAPGSGLEFKTQWWGRTDGHHRILQSIREAPDTAHGRRRLQRD